MTGVALQLGVCLAACSVAAASDGPARVLLDRRLTERTVQLAGMDDRTVSYIDEGGLIRVEPFTEFIAMLPESGDAPPPPRMALWLTDGQRLAGDLRPGTPPPGVVRWEHPALGAMDVSLEVVWRVTLLRPGEVAAAPTLSAPIGQDVVILTNGDLLSGFVESVGELVEIDVDGAVQTVPRERVVSVTLASPATAPQGSLVWLADGSVVAIDGVHTSPAGVVRLHPILDRSEGAGSEAAGVAPRGRSELRLSDIVGVLFDAGRVVPLASIAPLPQSVREAWAAPMGVKEPSEALLWAADLTLPAPMTVEWQLPARITRLSLTGQLPPDMWTWGDCELVISVVSAGGAAAEVARERLHADRPSVTVSMELPDGPGRVLRITLDAGRYGPIQDRVVLRRALLLTGP